MSDAQILYAWAVDQRTAVELTQSDLERDRGEQIEVMFEVEDYTPFAQRDDDKVDDWVAVTELNTGRALEIRATSCGAACKCALEVRLA